MNTVARVLTFGLISGLLWSVVPIILYNRFSIATVIAGIVAGIVTSSVLASLVARFGRAFTVVLGLLSLPLGAFIFGFSLAVVNRVVSSATIGAYPVEEPWTTGLTYALLSVISIFAIGLFPLAVFTTILLKKFIAHKPQSSPA